MPCRSPHTLDALIASVRSAAPVRAPRRTTLALAALMLVAACGGGGDAPTNPGPTPPTTPPPTTPPPTTPPLSGPTEAPAPTASTIALGPLQEVELSGLPAGRTNLQADITAAGAGSAAVPGPYQMPLLPMTGGRYRLLVPLHPTNGVEGGAVDVRVRGDSLVTAPLRLTLAPLPAAPGAFAGVLDSLQLLVDLSLAREGLTRSAVLASDARDVLPRRLLPLAIVQTLLDDPSHDRDLRDLLRGSSGFAPLLGQSTLNRETLDRLTAAVGVPALWNELLATGRAIRDSNAVAPRMSGGASSPSSVGPITNGRQLDAAMRQAAEAKRAVDPSNPKAKVRQDIGLVLGAAGLVAGTATGGVLTAVSLLQFVAEANLDAMAKTLPSEFVENSLTFDVDIPRFLEDEPGPGRYSNVRVSARSEGMVLDKVIVNAVLQVVGGVRTAGSLFDHVSGTTLPPSVVDQINNVGSFIVGVVAGKVPDADGVLRIPPETWSDIDLSGSQWTRARVAGTSITVGDYPTYLPVRTGESLLTVETTLSRFGDAAPAFARRTIEVAPIQIEIVASRSTVTPGDRVVLDITVIDALDPGLEWTLSAGSWVSGPTQLGSNAWRAEVQTPLASGVYPIRVTFTSTATGGARSTAGAPVRSATRQIFTGTVLVEPFDVTLLPGESQTFSAIVLGLDNKAVTWSATGPTGAPVAISSTGVFTAPTTLGEYRVTATSVQDPDVKGSAAVIVSGVCTWSLTIDGARGGTWSGAVAGHLYPVPASGSPGSFTMTFERDEDSDDGPIGSVQAVGPRAVDATGSWPALFSFAPVLGGPVLWTAIPASATYTDTDAVLSVSANDGSIVRGRVSGTAMLPIGEGQVQLAAFTLTFRSAYFFDCGPN